MLGRPAPAFVIADVSPNRQGGTPHGLVQPGLAPTSLELLTPLPDPSSYRVDRTPNP